MCVHGSYMSRRILIEIGEISFDLDDRISDLVQKEARNLIQVSIKT